MGLRYFMFYWPTVSATIGISTHVVLLSFLVGYVWYRLLSPNQVSFHFSIFYEIFGKLNGFLFSWQVVVRVGLNRATSSATLSTVPSQPTIATVEPQQLDEAQSKTLEQRRMEAREILMKEKKRQLTSPGVFTERNLIISHFIHILAFCLMRSFGTNLQVLAVVLSVQCQLWLGVRHLAARFASRNSLQRPHLPRWKKKKVSSKESPLNNVIFLLAR